MAPRQLDLTLTMAQALLRYLQAQFIEVDGHPVPMLAGVFAIFGHGNVAGLGEALASTRDTLPVWRAHNEQAMVHTATAFAKTQRRKRWLACTTSIGPGATNMVTGAATAHVNRLPVLLLPGDTFVSRRPDPVLQQLENFAEPLLSVNDCLRPVSRYFDRITRPEQLLQSLPQAVRTLNDPANCGPATLCLPQDIQSEAYNYPAHFFSPHVWTLERPRPDVQQIAHAIKLLRTAQKPLVIIGGGVLYSDACATLEKFLRQHHLPSVCTQAGKGALTSDTLLHLGGVGVTGTDAANALAREADVILALGTRLSDFTTASRTLFAQAEQIISINSATADAYKHGALPVVGDVGCTLEELSSQLGSWRAASEWQQKAHTALTTWSTTADHLLETSNQLPNDAQVVHAINQCATDKTVVVAAAGGLPGQLQRFWNVLSRYTYHVEYGYSCMGYEIAGGLGVKLAWPDADVIVMVGDGSYLMMNSEIATSVAYKLKLTIVVLDNRGFGCIHRLQQACGVPAFNNLLQDSGEAPAVDFVAHARSLGADAKKCSSLEELREAFKQTRQKNITQVLVIDTDPNASGTDSGVFWDVPIAAHSQYQTVNQAHDASMRRKSE